MIFVSIIYASCEPTSFVVRKSRAKQRSNRFLDLEFILLILLTTLCFKLKKMLFLSMHCIAYAFGKFGYTNVHPHENSIPLLYLFWLVTMLSHNQRCRDGT
jgi:hypothetical protein